MVYVARDNSDLLQAVNVLYVMMIPGSAGLNEEYLCRVATAVEMSNDGHGVLG